ncbi:MAG: hypothetical protein IIX01_03240 [Clostridia bacterium]|nr:hypothetical protein [Clostridia bacterium]
MNEQNKEYILNKYHDTKKPFNTFARFVRYDEIFDESTGLDGEEIKRKILENDEKIQDLSHPVRKAKAFAFVMENTRISCDKRDIFPAINSIDRPINKTIIPKWTDEAFWGKIPEVSERRWAFERDGIVAMWPDYDHSVPVWDRVFALGFQGLLDESERMRKTVAKTQEQEEFFEGIKITYESVLRLLERLQKQAEISGNEKLEKALGNIRKNPPKTFYEALLVDYIYFMLSEHIEGLQVRSLGNFDRLFYPFYQSDLKNGVSEEQIREELSYFFLQFTAIGNYWNQPVFLGGCKENEETEINELSYLFLDVYDKMNIYNPKIQIKVAKSTPKAFLLKALDMIRRGNNCIVFVSDKRIRDTLKKAGATEEEARLCNVKGCYEQSVQGGLDTGMNYFNLLKPFEYALHEGKDGITGLFAGRKSPSIDSYKTFEDFYTEYKNQLAYLIDCVVEIVNGYEDYLSYVNPQSLLSATYPTCLQTGKDALGGGAAENVTELAFGFLANISDSLAMVKKYVYDKKALSLKELRDMLDNDYDGNEKWRLIFFNDKEKYGNDRELPDFFAKDIVSFVSEYTCGRPNAKKRGGEWNCGFHVARMSYDQGRITAATPDGRKKGEELSKNVSASMGQNREGATAAVLTATKLDATAFVGDAALDLGLHSSAVKGNDGLEAMYGILNTFVELGGHALQINVFSAETLRDAQKHPEKYSDLQIRVCGWNTLWNDIVKVEQDGFIRQAESLQ